MSSFYPHSNALPASILLFSFPGNNLSLDNILRIGTIFNPNRLAPGLLNDMPSELGACPRGWSCPWSSMAVGRASSWQDGELGSGPRSRQGLGAGVDQGAGKGNSGARVDGVKVGGACWELGGRN